MQAPDRWPRARGTLGRFVPSIRITSPLARQRHDRAMTHHPGADACPSWCVSAHLDGDTLHHGESIAVQLTRRPTEGEQRFRPESTATPVTLDLVTHQEAGEPEPWVAVLHEGSAVLDLSATSAARLGAELQRLAGDAAH